METPPAPGSPSESGPETEEPAPGRRCSTVAVSGAETAAPPRARRRHWPKLSARDDLRRAPDVIDAALELLRKWLQRRAARPRSARDAGGRRTARVHCALQVRLCRAAAGGRRGAGDAVAAALGPQVAAHRGRRLHRQPLWARGEAAANRLPRRDVRARRARRRRGVALRHDRGAERAAARPRARKPPGRICGGLFAQLVEAAGRYAAARLDVIVAGAQKLWRKQARLAARNVAAAAKPADAGDGDAPGDGDGDGAAPVDAPKAAAAAAAAALSDKLVVQERRNPVLRQLGAESARWAALPSEAGALRELWTALPAAAATGMRKALDFRLRRAAFEATLRRKRGADIESAWNGEYSFVCGGEYSELYHAILRGGAELWTAVRAAEADEGEEAAAAADRPPAAALARRAARRRRTATPRQAARRRRAGRGGRRAIDEFGRTVGEAESGSSQRRSRRRSTAEEAQERTARRRATRACRRTDGGCGRRRVLLAPCDGRGALGAAAGGGGRRLAAAARRGGQRLLLE